MSRDGRPPTQPDVRDVRDSEHGPIADEPRSPKAAWVRLSGAGMELAFITIAFGAAGALIDSQTQLARPVCSAIGGLIGFSLGMVRFIRLATSISETQRELESSKRDESVGRVDSHQPFDENPDAFKEVDGDRRENDSD